MINPKITIAEIADFLNVTVQAVHARIKAQGLTEFKSNNKVFFGHETARRIINHKDLKQLIIAMSVVKGGVGKTTISENLAIRLALYGLKVLCVDADQQANLTKGLNMDEQAKTTPVLIDLIEGKANPKDAVLNVVDGLDLIPSRLDNVTLDGYLMIHRVNLLTLFKNLFSDTFKQYDVVIIDCPPTLGATVCASMLISDLVIAPLNPDVYSYEGILIMDKEINNLKHQFNRDLAWKILLNKFDSHTILSKNYIEIIKNENYVEKLFKSVIRASQEFSNVKKKQVSIFDNFRKNAAKEDIDQLAREVITLMSNHE